MVENFCLIAMQIFYGGRRGEGVPQNANDDNTHKKEHYFIKETVSLQFLVSPTFLILFEKILKY